MNLSECYEKLGGNYDDVLGRMRREGLVEKFMFKFLEDGSFDLLVKSMASGDHGEAFRAAHTLKGISSNLGFELLFESSSRLTEALRHGQSAEYAGLFEKVKADYEKTAHTIEAYKSEHSA